MYCCIAVLRCMALYCCIAIQWARDRARSLYCPIQQVFLVYCCRAGCIGGCAVLARAAAYDDLSRPAHGAAGLLCRLPQLDFGGPLRPGKQGDLDARRRAACRGEGGARPCHALREVQAWRARDLPQPYGRLQAAHVFRRWAWGKEALQVLRSCSPGKECPVGTAFLACHLSSKKHWKHWRLVAFGEAQPTDAEWQAFAALMPLGPKRAMRRN